MNINTEERICLIVNPKAGSGAAKSKLTKVQNQIGNYFQSWDIRKTQAAGHAQTLAKQACEEGFDIVAAIGGDGTCHEVINGMIADDKAISPKTSLALIPAGTGSDFMKSLPTPNDPIQALQAAAFGKSRIIDVGKCITQDQIRYFINVAGFGVNGEVAERSNSSSKMFGGKVSFIKATLQSSLSYKPKPVKIEWQALGENQNWTGELLSCFVANGKFCGGGMNVGPDSKIDDGLADITLLSPIGPIEQLFKLRKLYNGTVHELKQAQYMQSPILKASAKQNSCVKIELDGECGGTLPASFYILPQILPLRSFWE